MFKIFFNSFLMFLHILAIVLYVKYTLNADNFITKTEWIILGSLSCFGFIQATLRLIKLLK